MQKKLFLENLPELVIEQGHQLERIEKTLLNLNQPPSHVVDKRYTLPEASDYCRMAVPTFRSYLSKRKVSGIKFGKSWVFTQEDLDTFLNQYRVKTINELRQEANEYLRKNNK